ncbi:hypothetical protein TgHK011_006843 [Trichoderma gracile]|nr:hypothetical protein TgHK011_006843 [Trichoderma gracile]
MEPANPQSGSNQASYGISTQPNGGLADMPDWDDHDDPDDPDYEDSGDGEDNDRDYEDSDDTDGDDDEDEEYDEEEDEHTEGHAIHEREKELMKREKREKAEKLAKWKELMLGDIETEIRQAAKEEKQLDEAQFLAKYGDVLDHIMQESASKKNVLHMLAIHPFEVPSQFPRWIIDHIHRNATNAQGKTRNSLSKLLADKAHTTPSLALATAIRWKNEPFIHTILAIEREEGDDSLTASLRNNLRETVDAGDQGPCNCIHWSIENLCPDLTVQLIEKAANDQCLLAKNRRGFTPLHLAVEYPKCLERLEVIKTLLKFGEKALDQRCKEDMSAYRYYRKTMTDYQGKDSGKSSERSKTKAPLGRAQGDSKQSKEKQQAPKAKTDGREKNEPSDKTQALIDAKARIQDQVQAAEPVLRSPVEGGEAGRGKKSTALSKNSKDKEREKRIEDEIEDELKLQYLRSTFKLEPHRHVASAHGFLYPQGEERSVCLTMIGGPQVVDQHAFTKFYSNKNFDHILHNVAVSRIVSKHPKNKDAGRTDMEVIFKLLKDKGVRHIVKVIVFDSEAPPHSDESIERCFSGFKSIEFLDWRKIDLCPQTICKACPNVVELHLWLSGNNAVLMAWSAPGGLARLPRLKKIHLHQTQRIESVERDKKNLQVFKERLRNDRIAQRPKCFQPEERLKLASSGQRLPVTVLDMWPDITVNDSDTSNAAQPGRSPAAHSPQLNQTIARHRRRHDWLDIMDKFAAGIDLIDMERTRSPDIFAEEVRVALIDDGVEITNRNLTNRIYNGWTCDTGYEGNGLQGIPRPYTSSETQHGTFMASTICRICPRAKIFVFRLDVVSKPGERAHFTAKSAADALELAIDPSRKFDIISMSWTIARNQVNAKDMDRLDKALKRATAQNRVLLFCASPDSGEMTKAQAETFYPFGCDGGVGLFKMAAATVDGIRVSMAGSRFDYSLPGHEVEDTSQPAGASAREMLQKTSHASEVEHSGLKTGSSIATALGAGLAALIIYCVRLSAAYAHRLNPSAGTSANSDINTGVLGRNALELIKQPAQMRRIFDRMVSTGSSGDRYIEVWEFFGELADELEALGRHIEELKDIIDNEVQPGTAEAEVAEAELRTKNEIRMMKVMHWAVSFVSKL